jgi:7,8-dihydro-6-hydroxymethylpterin-pyrophosphokinase
LEAELGRVRSSDPYAARTIDMDLCFLDGVVQAGEGWSLPALHVLDRAHVALPLADLDPEFRHPVTGETLASASARVARGAQLTRCEDIVLTPPADAGDPA